MKTVEKKDDSATRIEQWKQEENSTKKKNPLNCCSLFEKYCNRINNCRPLVKIPRFLKLFIITIMPKSLHRDFSVKFIFLVLN